MGCGRSRFHHCRAGRIVGSRVRCAMENGHAKATDCPDRAELAAFATGNLSAKAFKRITRHVEGCPACETALGALDDHADALVSRLRGTAVDDLAVEEPVPP